MRRFVVAVGVVVAVGAARAEPTFYTARVAPILERHCVVCHGPEKQKARLRLDTFDHVVRGAESGVVVKAGDVKGSELYRRITLPRTDEEAMPSDGKPELSADEIRIFELWIASGASASKSLAEFPTAPVPKAAAAPVVALTADWRPRAGEIAVLEKAAGVRLVPRSLVATDGLVLRTASAPGRCDDAAIARLAPVAEYIVEAELARTKVTDIGLKTVATWPNLRRLDLTRTAVTTAGLPALATLTRLEGINLTDTSVDDAGVSALKSLPALKHAWLFGTKSSTADLVRTEVSK